MGVSLAVMFMIGRARALVSQSWRVQRFGQLAASAVRGIGTKGSLSARGGADIGEEDSEVAALPDMGALAGSFLSGQDRAGFLFGEEQKTFRQLGVGEELCGALEKLGMSVATTIQSMSFPVILSGKDAVIAAETGSGKTYSYLIPLMQKCLDSSVAEGGGVMSKYPSVVVMVPNKELCLQVHRMAQDLAGALKELHGATLHIKTVTSPTDRWPFSPEVGPQILVCTPTFFSRLVKGGHAIEPDLFRAVKHLVLDEADMLLEGSYLRDVENVLSAFKLVRREMIGAGEIKVHETVLQQILSAATLPSYGLRSMDKYVEYNFPRAVKVSSTFLHKHHPRIEQSYLHMKDDSLVSTERVEAIKSACVGGESTMIFVNTAESAEDLANALQDSHFECAQFHKLSHSRQSELEKFRKGDIKVIVCTDAAARGLDLPNVRHVIQAEFALNVVQHMHRIGRASRAGVAGRATCLYDSRSEMIVDSIKSGIVSSFSRRRGLRKKWKKVGEDNTDDGLFTS